MAGTGTGPVVDELTAAERIGTCVQLAGHWYGRFHTRRQVEWKFAFGLWTLLSAAVPFLDGKGSQYMPLWLFIAFGLLYSFTWLRGVWVSNEYDKQMANYYDGQAQRLLNDPRYRPPPEPMKPQVSWLKQVFGFLTSWGTVGQLITTAALLVVAYYSMTHTPRAEGGFHWPFRL